MIEILSLAQPPYSCLRAEMLTMTAELAALYCAKRSGAALIISFIIYERTINPCFTNLTLNKQSSLESSRSLALHFKNIIMKIYQLFPYLTLLSAPVWAGPHFLATPVASITSTGALQVCFDEAGLGNTDINYQLTADETAEFGCFNNGGNHPKASNKETVSATISTAATFQPKNGRVQACVTGQPPSPGAFSCPPGQVRLLISVTDTNIVLNDTTNVVVASVPSVSQIFIKGA